MIRRIWRLITGYIVVTVKGRRVEQFLNRMASAGILIWDVERMSTGMLVARMEASGFKRARALCRHRGWEIAVADRLGMPFWATRLLRRKGLFIGALLALVCLYVASGYIWFVEVEGIDGKLVDEVLAVAEQAGLKPMVRVGTIDPKDIQLELLLNIDEVSWAFVHLRGTRAVIEVAERTVFDTSLSRPGDIVASRDGIIEKIAVSQGYPVVQVGDTVRQGDIIISGFIPPDDPRHRQMLLEGKTPYVRADGVVVARVWYEGISRVRLIAQNAKPTGKKSWKLQLSVGERQFAMGKGETSFKEYEKRDWSREFSLFSWPIRIEYGRFIETMVTRTTISEDEAARQATEIALADLEAQLPKETDIIDGPFVDIVHTDGEAGPVIEVRATVETMSDIRTYRVYH